ncbi:hypothetical protein GUITHDRAFT_106341 [Guillardia theta CCMP2712]|uniref:Uncharacterized protein n=1 Tax=Guillardia theta (strain CCMP2712) TaxID=905079 RepID=L1JHL5_GUITC|nr:hypothetical protein GUITHDRAFT_106341 [Guillardia theta CCMP2712]EKX47787.1 hypothetical protein GUITHDRAFT_106341 [Guillardia theta CCMP2712]|eukprot:XP_005834767.1 hypothetical protein GUITHDRAFT_106341 [Guillardia theta CCMP2712]
MFTRCFQFTIRRRLYELERTLYEEYLYDHKSPKLPALESEIREVLNASRELLIREQEQAFDDKYDHETIVEVLAMDIEEAQKELQEKLHELATQRTKNSLLEAQLAISVKKQETPPNILTSQEQLRGVYSQSKEEIQDLEDDLLELEMKLIELEKE